MGEPLFKIANIPYFNSLTAGQYGVSSWFDASMPASHILNSFATLGSYQGPGQTYSIDLFQDPRSAEEARQALPPDKIAEQMGIDPNYKPDSKCAAYDIPCQFGEAVTGFIQAPIVKDYSKRVGLTLLAALILVVAILSLR